MVLSSCPRLTESPPCFLKQLLETSKPSGFGTYWCTILKPFWDPSVTSQIDYRGTKVPNKADSDLLKTVFNLYKCSLASLGHAIGPEMFLSWIIREFGLPVGLDIVRSAEELDLPRAGRQPLYHAVDLIWFVAGGADLRQSVQTVTSWKEFEITTRV